MANIISHALSVLAAVLVFANTALASHPWENTGSFTYIAVGSMPATKVPHGHVAWCEKYPRAWDCKKSNPSKAVQKYSKQWFQEVSRVFGQVNSTVQYMPDVKQTRGKERER